MKCECVGVRCGAHPLGRCGKEPATQYWFRLAATGAIRKLAKKRLYCQKCGRGLKAIPVIDHMGEKRRTGRVAPNSSIL